MVSMAAAGMLCRVVSVLARIRDGNALHQLFDREWEYQMQPLTVLEKHVNKWIEERIQ